jgi:aerobic-type carbon monoxide dehydrogenase small subunit (CoxS/CutS family)
MYTNISAKNQNHAIQERKLHTGEQITPVDKGFPWIQSMFSQLGYKQCGENTHSRVIENWKEF